MINSQIVVYPVFSEEEIGNYFKINDFRVTPSTKIGKSIV